MYYRVFMNLLCANLYRSHYKVQNQPQLRQYNFSLHVESCRDTVIPDQYLIQASDLREHVRGVW